MARPRNKGLVPPPSSAHATWGRFRPINGSALRILARYLKLHVDAQVDWQAEADLINRLLESYAASAAATNKKATNREKLEWCNAARDACKTLLLGLGEPLPGELRDVEKIWDGKLTLSRAWGSDSTAGLDWERQLGGALFDALPTSRIVNGFEFDLGKLRSLRGDNREEFRLVLDILAPCLRATMLVADQAAAEWSKDKEKGGSAPDNGRKILFQSLREVYVSIFGIEAAGLNTLPSERRGTIPAGKIFDWHRVLLSFAGRRANRLHSNPDVKGPLTALGDWARGDRQGSKIGDRDGLAWRIRDAAKQGGQGQMQAEEL